jgi:hypothetical protein
MMRFSFRRFNPVILSAILVATVSLAFPAGEVRLIKASSILIKDSTRSADTTVALDTNSIQRTFFLIFIKNIAYSKQVSLLVKKDAGWDTLPCDWVRQADDENEYWIRTMDFTLRDGRSSAPRDLEFKIQYVEGIHIYWDDNHGKNFILAKDGGSLLNGGNILVKSAKWQEDTANLGATVFSGEVEVRGSSPTNSLRISYSTDYLKSQDVKLVAEKPVPTWTGTTAPADTDCVYVYRFSFGNIKMPAGLSPRIQFTAAYLTDKGTFSDNNLAHSYSLELGWGLDNLSEALLPLPVGIHRPLSSRIGRKVPKGFLRMLPSPVFDAGIHGSIDGIGRVR